MWISESIDVNIDDNSRHVMTHYRPLWHEQLDQGQLRHTAAVSVVTGTKMWEGRVWTLLHSAYYNNAEVDKIMLYFNDVFFMKST